MKFPFAKGGDHKQMLQNILHTSMNHEEVKSKVSIIIHFLNQKFKDKYLIPVEMVNLQKVYLPQRQPRA